MRITALYAALGALLIVVLAVRVMLQRRTARVGIHDGGDHQLAKRIRAHANAVEYLPIALLLMLLLEANQTQPPVLHAIGIALIAGRILHAWGLSRTSAVSFGRAAGIALTLLAIVASAALLLWQYLLF
ncbi:MAPEG family protein [Dokdonella koreensis]|uniref:Membrane protein n=1 Tax=Dokdonella koreensis DS-123 TaxID=1300342 RepID=A0A160DVV2_9GAMM|nr:MAPEG family protein [Dokdonella koreensis]ANB17953.1 Putative membrane protein [Dokdonella koreensis DS-123]